MTILHGSDSGSLPPLQAMSMEDPAFADLTVKEFLTKYCEQRVLGVIQAGEKRISDFLQQAETTRASITALLETE